MVEDCHSKFIKCTSETNDINNAINRSEKIRTPLKISSPPGGLGKRLATSKVTHSIVKLVTNLWSEDFNSHPRYSTAELRTPLILAVNELRSHREREAQPKNKLNVFSSWMVYKRCEINICRVCYWYCDKNIKNNAKCFLNNN